MFKVTNGNTKLGSICSINLPYKKTCNPKAPCFNDCYCRKGNMIFPVVVNCYENNYQSFMNNPIHQTEEEINKQIPTFGYCRIHASGDFINRSYFDMLVRIAKKNKRVKFMAFTKQFDIVNEYLMEKKLPKNFIIIFSAWYDNTWEVINPFNLPVAYVYNKKVNNTYDEKAFHCLGKCDKCLKCWNLKKGESVVFKKH